MNAATTIRRRFRRAARLSALLLAFLALTAMAGAALANESMPPADQEPWRAAMATADPALEGLADADVRRLGQAMYRDGILPSGEAMTAFIHGDIEVDSTAFSCASCHQRAGLGSFEGGVVTPPTTGRKLYQKYHRPPSMNDIEHEKGRYVYAKTIIERPAYTRDSLKSALRDGVDPAGELFNDVMPRYPLGDRDMAILVRYLELLSAEEAPGASSELFRFATIITDDVSAADREALLAPLQHFVTRQNKQVVMYRKFVDTGFKPTVDMKYSFRTVSLTVWELKGPPATWAAQLTDWYEKEPVFAVLGGISNQSWQPIHDFCESRQLPCLFPITDLPAISDGGWYTFYFNKGYYLEGETAARYLNRPEGMDSDTRILQLVEDSPASAKHQRTSTSFRPLRQNSGVVLVLPLGIPSRSAIFSNHSDHSATALRSFWRTGEKPPFVPRSSLLCRLREHAAGACSRGGLARSRHNRRYRLGREDRH